MLGVLLLSIKENKMGLIDGFAINCRDSKRVITLKDGVYRIGCSSGTKEQVIKTITIKYNNKEQEDYLKRLNDCEDMKWLTDEIHRRLKDDENERVRLAVAKYSDKYHEQLKDDSFWAVRKTVIEYKGE